MSTESVYCGSCGATIASTAKFCKSCGTPRGPAITDPPGGDDAPTVVEQAAVSHESSLANGGDSERKAGRETFSPVDKVEVGEFTAAVKSYAALPGVRLAGVASLIGAGLVLAVSLLVAILAADNSLLSIGNEDLSIGLLSETFLQATSMNLSSVSFADSGAELVLQRTPLIFVLIPLAGVGFGVFSQFKGTTGWSPRAALLWSASTAVPFSLIMVLLVLLSRGEIGDTGITGSANLGSTFLLAFVWGAVGGVLGATFALRKRGAAVSELLPEVALRPLQAALDLLRPLVVGLLVASVIGSSVWVVQSVRDVADARDGRSLVASVIDSVAYTGDLGVRFVGLGTGAQFERSEITQINLHAPQTPIPVSDELAGYSKLSELTDNEKFNLFSFEKVLGTWAFIPLTLLLIGIPLLLALYAGFSTARNRRPASQATAAGWGALVGPVWALTLVILNALSEGFAFGSLSGDSVFAIVLIAGAALGAGGGLLAFSQRSDNQNDSTFKKKGI